MPRSPLFLALLNPVNLAMLALTAAAGLCSAWWLAPIGFVLWLVMVILIARDPGLQMTFTRQNRQPLAQRYQFRFDRLERARFSVFNTLSQSSPQLRRALEPVELALDELVEHAYQLCLRMSALDNNLAVQQISSNFNEDIAKLEKSIAETSDPTARREFEAALQSLQTRQAQLKEISTLLSRFEAQLTGTISAVDGVVTGVVSLKGRSPQFAAEKIPALLQILQTEQDELTQFDRQLETSSIL
ncbi:MAG: hypothetical protein DDG60_07865 [Anaerolineae bacterium]|nr:MAG: hypothetical protein DDG60_07865 [Anaerolineae bacterium]